MKRVRETLKNQIWTLADVRLKLDVLPENWTILDIILKDTRLFSAKIYFEYYSRSCTAQSTIRFLLNFLRC